MFVLFVYWSFRASIKDEFHTIANVINIFIANVINIYHCQCY